MLTVSKAALTLLLCVGTAAAADPWKDESGNGRYEDRYNRYDRDEDRYDRNDRYYGDGRGDGRWTYGVPRGHLPPPGICRVWFPDRSAGHQPAPTSCRRAHRIAYQYGGEVIRGRRHR